MDNFSLFFLIFGASNKNPMLDFIMIFGAEYVIYLTFFMMFFFSIKGGLKEKKSLILALICLPIGVLIVKIIHLFFLQQRPFVTYDFLPLISQNADASFPSRHTITMSVVAFPFTYFKSKWAPLFLFLTLWVGVSRIYVGVHYPMDILGGILVGMITLIVALQIKKLLKIRLFT